MISLNTQEQAVLDAAASRHIQVVTKLQAAERELAQLREEANGVGQQMQGAFRAVLTLKGLNPDAHTGHWSEEEGKVIVEEIAPPEPSIPASAEVIDAVAVPNTAPSLSVVPEVTGAE